MAFTRKEEAVVDRIGATRDRALGLFWIGLRYMDTEGQYEDGLALMERSYRLAKQLAFHDVLHATCGLLYGNASLGRWERIDALLDEHVTAFHQEPDMTCPFIRGGPLIAAAILAHCGDIERARDPRHEPAVDLRRSAAGGG